MQRVIGFDCTILQNYRKSCGLRVYIYTDSYETRLASPVVAELKKKSLVKVGDDVQLCSRATSSQDLPPGFTKVTLEKPLSCVLAQAARIGNEDVVDRLLPAGVDRMQSGISTVDMVSALPPTQACATPRILGLAWSITNFCGHDGEMITPSNEVLWAR
jgi:hypothetical protein